MAWLGRHIIAGFKALNHLKHISMGLSWRWPGSFHSPKYLLSLSDTIMSKIC
jgi:hypothetical protein